MVRVHLIHGLEGSPNGRKRRALDQVDGLDVRCPAMDTSDLDGCIAVHADHLEASPPDIVVGSSFGGAVACALLDRGWRGPTLLLAPAWRKYLGAPPAHGGFTTVHGMDDDVIPFTDSVALASHHRAPLLPVHDDHRLAAWTDSGALAVLVQHLCEVAAGGES